MKWFGVYFVENIVSKFSQILQGNFAFFLFFLQSLAFLEMTAKFASGNPGKEWGFFDQPIFADVITSSLEYQSKYFDF